MKPQPVASIVVNNYNYSRYLRAAIDSALRQSYAHTEVVVVDDGSTDDSRDVIASYGDRIVPVLKVNGGQNSAFNAGLRASKGDVICFLDADDFLFPRVMEHAVLKFCGSADVAMVHWPLWEVDATGNRNGRTVPSNKPEDGSHLRERVLRDGPDCYAHPPTSGLSWSRGFLDKVFPLSEQRTKTDHAATCADAYLAGLAPLYGSVHSLAEPHGCYRIHGANSYVTRSFDERLHMDLLTFNARCDALADHARRLGLACAPDVWRAQSWICRLAQAGTEIASVVPATDKFLLVDDAKWGMDTTTTRKPIPFLERDGVHWGAPADDATAIRELERMRQAGAAYIVFGWPSFWWLDHFQQFAQHLYTNYRRVLQNERLMVFDLRGER
jgi:glycosyltransferase involved in cell wall biosynthesis